MKSFKRTFLIALAILGLTSVFVNAFSVSVNYVDIYNKYLQLKDELDELLVENNTEPEPAKVEETKVEGNVEENVIVRKVVGGITETRKEVEDKTYSTKQEVNTPTVEDTPVSPKKEDTSVVVDEPFFDNGEMYVDKIIFEKEDTTTVDTKKETKEEKIEPKVEPVVLPEPEPEIITEDAIEKTTPESGENDIVLKQRVYVYLKENFRYCNNLTKISITDKSGQNVSFSLYDEYNRIRLVFNLMPKTTYVITMEQGFAKNGEVLSKAHSFEFTTGEHEYHTIDAVEKISPADKTKNVVMGTKIKITFKDNFIVLNGYEDKIKLFDADNKEVKCDVISDNNKIVIIPDNVLTLKMEYRVQIDGNVAVYDETAFTNNPAGSTFTVCSNIYGIKDIDKSWAKDEILDFLGKGILSAYEDRTFKPENSIKKGEAVKLVLTALNDKLPSVELTGKYQGHWSGEYVERAEMLNLLPSNFMNNGLTSLNEYITRSDLAIIISRTDLYLAGQLDNYLKELNDYKNNGINSANTLKSLKMTYQKVFGDDDGLNYESYKLILYAYGKGYINGYEDGTFKAGNNLTRAEAVVILTRLLEG